MLDHRCAYYYIEKSRLEVSKEFHKFHRLVIQSKPNNEEIPIDQETQIDVYKEKLLTLHIRVKSIRSCDCSKQCEGHRCHSGNDRLYGCPWVNTKPAFSRPDHWRESIEETVGAELENDILMLYCKMATVQREWMNCRKDFYDKFKRLQEDCSYGRTTEWG